ncbi:MAG: YidC/Oxa1 family insertase periplasmic-domain containing protein [Candidatus Eisenbacteria bacterium]
MDKRTSFALALCMVVFAAFTLLQAKFAPPPKKPITPIGTLAPQDSSAALSAPDSSAPAPQATLAGSAGAAATVPAIEARSYVLETPLYVATFINRGARLQSFELKHFAAAHGSSDYATDPHLRPRFGKEVPQGDRVNLNGAPAFGLDLGQGESLRSLANVTFAVAESLDANGVVRGLTFTWQDSAGALVRQSWRVRPDTYLLDYSVELKDLPQDWRVRDYSLTARSWPLLTESSAQLDQRAVRAVSLVGANLHRDPAGGNQGKTKLHEGVAHWAGVQTHYFLGVVASLNGEGRASTGRGERRTLTDEQFRRLPSGDKREQDVAVGTLVMPLPIAADRTHHLAVYFGPGDYFALAKLSEGLGKDVRLERAVDMGWSWLVPVSKLLLKLLNLIDGVVRNYGISILLVALVVRLALHPLNMASMKSMRAMQRLQPEIERIRKKYDGDAPAMNTAMMALYKDNKVNPAGGCLPMVMQMPLFFALFAVLNNAIDLRHAPFYGWIHDLSAPDLLFNLSRTALPVVGVGPIRLLPILMAFTGFLSQKFTPTDPKQAPTMYMMNFVMLIFFYNLPSGLVLYWTVMNLLTALQQWMALRGEPAVVVAPVVVETGRRKR